MMYVNERRADSIWVTELWFLVMKLPYILSHFGGKARAFGTRPLADLSVSIARMRKWDEGEEDVMNERSRDSRV